MLRVFSDARCLGHAAPRGYPESPARLSGILDEARRRGFEIAGAGGHPAARATVESLHDPGYVARFAEAAQRGDGLLDSADNPLSPGSWDAAWGAVDATLHAADWAAGPGRRAFAAVRPPGHHAERDMAMGFCFFSNAGLAAQRLLTAHGLARVAIVDFDVHHGNGTQHLFEERADVFYLSLHQYPFYPGSGAASERGRGAGRGATLNVPLPAGTGDEGYRAAFEEQVLPALREFAPAALVVSAGFDAWARDPLGGMRVSEGGFRDWGSWLSDLASEVCEDRIVAVLEGGYDLQALPALAVGHLEALSGRNHRVAGN
jgi:acetoin utilization deacetylase AcuC-like enzyme